VLPFVDVDASFCVPNQVAPCCIIAGVTTGSECSRTGLGKSRTFTCNYRRGELLLTVICHCSLSAALCDLMMTLCFLFRYAYTNAFTNTVVRSYVETRNWAVSGTLHLRL
jgi:hypothetical protein